MTIAINVSLVLLGAVIAAVTAFGETHYPGSRPALRRLNGRGWTIVTAVVLALILGVAKEYLADYEQSEQHRLLTELLASREADHNLLTRVLSDGLQLAKGPQTHIDAALLKEYQDLLAQRQTLLREAEYEAGGYGTSRRAGVGPAYNKIQQRIHDIDERIAKIVRKIASG
ncbi:MAG TPA: hypothetical protein VJU77_03155 [Chthoniobacterales bacterium]|nr:hypothetical protein [Chthoniobacterales bacterium]